MRKNRLMRKKDKNDYIVLFQGAKLSEREANKAGLGIIFGIIGIIFSIITVGPTNNAGGRRYILVFDVVIDMGKYNNTKPYTHTTLTFELNGKMQYVVLLKNDREKTIQKSSD